ncbi:hypothetical protein SCHIN_v1c07920 [Spiroplasma chinense]|uniref:Transposase n=1 Tax=Spiroplasma chinense TaxID=216932 RepID=A0A5B9Y481_9MOLU|nr:hypothetical protein [Spiroplasma chinense]QEH61424.1 hypothetical protein SCHIN_v1c02270 [Spiroplasma chinense]QEH61476.1 hypothetical protein SCHIN_v1c02790 [Spiroplasma chinense]QEH61987.1 hypothetical protein SCHIN_v1c07920 [Spiroplasma chinense]
MANKKGNKSNILTPEQRKRLVNDHFKKDLSWRELSIKYNVSYSAARQTCIRFENEGEASFEVKSGNSSNHTNIRVNSVDPRDKQIAQLLKRNKELEMENEIIKKFKEFTKNQKTK